jgi:hypothetical protein
VLSVNETGHLAGVDGTGGGPGLSP